MKSKTLIYLDLQDLNALRAEARTHGISLAELMRRLVRQHLEKRHPASPPSAETYLKLVALGMSGRADISERHDVYLADAFRRKHAR